MARTVIPAGADKNKRIRALKLRPGPRGKSALHDRLIRKTGIFPSKPERVTPCDPQRRVPFFLISAGTPVPAIFFIVSNPILVKQTSDTFIIFHPLRIKSHLHSAKLFLPHYKRKLPVVQRQFSCYFLRVGIFGPKIFLFLLIRCVLPPQTALFSFLS